jgi:hypothetical protein
MICGIDINRLHRRNYLLYIIYVEIGQWLASWRLPLVHEQYMKYNIISRGQCDYLVAASGGLATHPICYKILGRQRVLLSTLVSIKMKGLAIVH